MSIWPFAKYVAKRYYHLSVKTTIQQQQQQRNKQQWQFFVSVDKKFYSTHGNHILQTAVQYYVEAKKIFLIVDIVLSLVSLFRAMCNIQPNSVIINFI